MFYYVNVEDKIISSGFEMKKSCIGKGSKLVTTEDVKDVLNDSKEEVKKELTEEELNINKKLSESGIQEQGLGWLEKRNIYKTINVSLNTTGSERLQRSSPRLAKINNSKGAKWIENSFENAKSEDSQNKSTNFDETSKSKLGKGNSEINNSSARKANSSLSNKEVNESSEAVTPKTSQKKEVLSDRCKKDSSGNSDSPKSTKRVHYIKVQVEGSSKVDSNISVETNSNEEGNHTPAVGKKRVSHSEEGATDAAKKLKMEQTDSDKGVTNNGISSEKNEIPLKIELELEKRRNMPFKVRDIKTIVSECEFRNKKWKETFLKYKCPARWGIPMVKNCSEKWDGKQIPQKLLHRFQKYLSSNNLCHPIFFPVKDSMDADSSKVNSEISSQSSAGMNNDYKDELLDEFRKVDAAENSFADEDKNQFNAKKQNSENNVNASGSGSESSGRMVLRNRNHYKPVVVDEDEFSSDDSDEWLSKQKPNKKQKTNSKNKKSVNQSNQQLLLKLERCNLNKKNGCEDDGKIGSRDDEPFVSGPLIVSNTLSGAEGNSKPNPDLDTEVCPICSLRFKKQHIENHASECASKTYKD